MSLCLIFLICSCTKFDSFDDVSRTYRIPRKQTRNKGCTCCFPCSVLSDLTTNDSVIGRQQQEVKIADMICLFLPPHIPQRSCFSSPSLSLSDAALLHQRLQPWAWEKALGIFRTELIAAFFFSLTGADVFFFSSIIVYFYFLTVLGFSIDIYSVLYSDAHCKSIISFLILSYNNPLGAITASE